MDAPRFDTLTKQVGQRRGRRHVLAGLLGAALLTPLSDAAAKGGTGRANRRGRVTSQNNGECATRCKELFSSKKARGQCIAQGAHGEGPCTCLGKCPFSGETSDGRTVCGGGVFAGCTPCSGDDECSPLEGLEQLEPRCLLSYTDETTGFTRVMAEFCGHPAGTATCVRFVPCSTA